MISSRSSKPRSLFRDDGHVIRTAPSHGWVLYVVTVVLALSSVISLYALGQYMDDADAEHLMDSAEQRRAAFEEGRAVGHAEMVATAQAAWQAAQVEYDRCMALRRASR